MDLHFVFDFLDDIINRISFGDDTWYWDINERNNIPFNSECIYIIKVSNLGIITTKYKEDVLKYRNILDGKVIIIKESIFTLVKALAYYIKDNSHSRYIEFNKIINDKLGFNFLEGHISED